MKKGSTQHVLVVTTKLDLASDAVVRELSTRGIQFTRINTEDLPFQSTIHISFNSDFPDSTICFAEADDIDPQSSIAPTAIWYRRLRSATCPPEMDDGVYQFCIDETRATLIGAVLSRDFPCMNSPRAVAAAEHKLLQLHVAHSMGMTIPRTVATNSPNGIRRAYREFDGQMIVKPIHSGYFRRENAEYAIYTSQVLGEHLNDAASARLSPSMYQQLIKKKCDVRVTIVGAQQFVAEIDSQSDPAAIIDWRKTVNPNLPHRRAKIPELLSRQLSRFMKHLDLTFGAVDLVRTPEDEYVFLEVNPGGQWLWLDDQLQFGITDAIVDWLLSAQ